MMVYLAGRFDRQAEFCQYREELGRIDIEVVSRWLNEPSNAERVAAGKEPYTDREWGELASHDLEDVARANLVVAFTESADVGHTSGGRHVETGAALALGKPLIVVGSPENIFHRLTVKNGYDVTVCADWHTSLIEIMRRNVERLREDTRVTPRASRTLAARA
jgi:nucleoside 2-deoxyribosyltransferase